MTNDQLAQMVEMKLNDAVLGIHQTQNPITRAKRAGDLTDYLMARIEDLAAIRRKAVAEALEWPGGSMENVTAELGLSRSAVVKLAPADLRKQIADELRERLARGFNPPPLRPGAARLARKGLSASATPEGPEINPAVAGQAGQPYLVSPRRRHPSEKKHDYEPPYIPPGSPGLL